MNLCHVGIYCVEGLIELKADGFPVWGRNAQVKQASHLSHRTLSAAAVPPPIHTQHTQGGGTAVS